MRYMSTLKEKKFLFNEATKFACAIRRFSSPGQSNFRDAKIYANNYRTHTEAVESETNIPECQFLQTLTSLTVLRQTHSLTRHNSNCISDDPIPHFEFRHEYVNVR